MPATFLKTTQSYQPGARTMPGHRYTSPKVYADERERILDRAWLCVGRAGSIPKSGDFFLQTVGAESLIITRDNAEIAHAFYNVCRHRGTRLCTRERGNFSETIQCPYHAWTYRTDGRLVGAPHMGDVEGFDKRDFPLHSVALREWEGFLFVNLAREPEPFDGVFAPVYNRLSRFNLHTLSIGHRIVYDVKANWKLVFQNYSECLHCPVIHPELSNIMPYQSGENDLVEGPFLGGFMLLTPPNASATMTGRACAILLGDLPEEERQRAYYYTIFPNLMLSIHPDYVVYYTLWPDGPANTRIVCEWLFHPDAANAPGFNPDDAIEFWDTTNRQDWSISEQSFAGISSRAYVPGPYSPRESIPAAWDREYLRRMQEG